MIRKIRIRNFKSLRDVSVALEAVTVLIGRSGTGKSNFVQALRFLRDYLTKPEQAVQAWGGWPRLLCATHPEDRGKLSFHVEFDLPSLEGTCAYELQLEFQMTRPQPRVAFSGESLKFGNRVLFAQTGKNWTQEPGLVELPTPGRPALGLLHGIREVSIAHTVLTEGIGFHDFGGDVLMSGRHAQGTETGLNDDASNYLTTLATIARDLGGGGPMREIEAALRRLNSTVTTVQLADQGPRVRVGHQVGADKVLPFDISQESEGFRRFLAHMIALYQRPSRHVLAFEEPEKSIYPGALAVLAEYFQAAADVARSQVIITTHSPELLKHFAPQQIRVVTMEGYETRIGTLAPEQRESLEEHLMTADGLLTVDEARIDPSSTSA